MPRYGARFLPENCIAEAFRSKKPRADKVCAANSSGMGMAS